MGSVEKMGLVLTESKQTKQACFVSVNTECCCWGKCKGSSGVISETHPNERKNKLYPKALSFTFHIGSHCKGMNLCNWKWTRCGEKRREGTGTDEQQRKTYRSVKQRSLSKSVKLHVNLVSYAWSNPTINHHFINVQKQCFATCFIKPTTLRYTCSRCTYAKVSAASFHSFSSKTVFFKLLTYNPQFHVNSFTTVLCTL